MGCNCSSDNGSCVEDLVSKQAFLVIPANATCAICLEGIEENEGTTIPVIDAANEKNQQSPHNESSQTAAQSQW